MLRQRAPLTSANSVVILLQSYSTYYSGSVSGRRRSGLPRGAMAELMVGRHPLSEKTVARRKLSPWGKVQDYEGHLLSGGSVHHSVGHTAHTRKSVPPSNKPFGNLECPCTAITAVN